MTSPALSSSALKPLLAPISAKLDEVGALMTQLNLKVGSCETDSDLGEKDSRQFVLVVLNSAQVSPGCEGRAGLVHVLTQLARFLRTSATTAGGPQGGRWQTWSTL